MSVLRRSPARSRARLTGGRGVSASTCQHHARQSEKKRRPKCFFFLIYVMVHLKPTARNVRNVLYTPQTGFISVTTWRTKCKPMLSKIASIVDEIRPENRYHKDNHSAFFPKGVTGIIDCAPIRVAKPRRSRPSKQLYQVRTSCQRPLASANDLLHAAEIQACRSENTGHH